MDEPVASMASEGNECEFELARELRSVGVLNSALDQWLPGRGVPEPVLRALQVCCDEILANAIKHSGEVPEPVYVRIVLGDSQVKAQFAYRAEAFDPSQRPRPNTHTPISLRDIGGLGIHLIKSLSDRFEYHYRDGHHCLQLEKEFPP